MSQTTIDMRETINKYQQTNEQRKATDKLKRTKQETKEREKGPFPARQRASQP
jgi:hypothetical protein